MSTYEDTEEDVINLIPYCSEQFSMLSVGRDVTEAYSALIENCKTVSEAIKIVHEGEPQGLYKPNIFLASDWVAYANEQGYDKNLYLTRFTDPTRYPG